MSTDLSFEKVHDQSNGSIVWANEETYISCGDDGLIKINALANNEQNVQVFKNHTAKVNSIASSGDRFVSGSEDRRVLFFQKNAQGVYEYDKIITRFDLPVLGVDISTNGEEVAAGSENGTIKLVAVSDLKAKTIKAHKGSVLDVKFNPQEQILGSISSDGFKIWDYTQEQAQEVFSKKFMTNQTKKARLSWSPSGKHVAFPVGNDISLLSQGNEPHQWKAEENLKGHKKAIIEVAFSPNGQLLLSYDLDKTVMVWNVARRSVIASYSHSTVLASAAWNPTSEKIALLDQLGRLAFWPSPSEEIQNKEKVQQNNNDSLASDDLDDIDMEDFDDMPEKSTKQGGSAPSLPFLPEADESSSDEQDQSSKNKKKDKKKKLIRDLDDSDADSDDFSASDSVDLLSTHTRHPTFQPSASPLDRKQRYLCYNKTGSMICNFDGTKSVIQVNFHDTARFRPMHMTDRTWVQYGALCEKGVAYASQETEDAAATVCFAPSDHQSTKWSVQLPENEQIKVLGVSKSFIVAGTSNRYLRFFTLGGVQTRLISTPGELIALTCFEDLVAYVYQAGESLQYSVLNAQALKPLSRGELPLSAKAELNWVGFSTIGNFSTFDSSGILRVLFNDDIWAPCLDSRSIPKERYGSLWMIGLTESTSTFVLLRESEICPTIPLNSHPTTAQLNMPLLQNHLEFGKWEETLTRSTLFYSFKEKTLDAQQKLKEQAMLDTHILHLIEIALKADKHDQVLSLCKLFTFQKPMVGAVHLANSFNLSSLAARIKQQMEQQFPEKSQTSQVLQTSQTLQTSQPEALREESVEKAPESMEVLPQNDSRESLQEESDHEESIKESSKDEEEIAPVLKKSKVEVQRKNKFSVTAKDSKKSGSSLDFLAELSKQADPPASEDRAAKPKKTRVKSTDKKVKGDSKPAPKKTTKNSTPQKSTQRTLKEIF